MENKEKKPVTVTIRFLHRNVGFFILGFVIIYALSGIALIFRDTDFLKHEIVQKTTLPPQTKPEDLGRALRMREFKIQKTEGDVIYFEGGSFNTTTGEAQYKVKELVFPFDRLTKFHQSPSRSPFHWFTLTFAILLLFMAISSFWMFNRKSKIFRNGLYTILAGIAVAAIIILFVK